MNFDKFKELALNKFLSDHEKSDFKVEDRAGYETLIVADWLTKIPEIAHDSKCVLNIGCGSALIKQLLKEMDYEGYLVLVDSKEVLDNIIVTDNRLDLRPGKFPEEQNLAGLKFDAIVANSVLQYVEDPFRFIDAAVGLLAPSGKLLLSDIPNLSKARRFFSTKAGIEYHQIRNKTNELPDLSKSEGNIADDMILGIVERYRQFGYNVYLLPQHKDLPMSNRREDILIERLPL